MKFVVFFCCSILTTLAVDFQFIKVENCSSSDEKLVTIEICSFAGTSVNFSMNHIKPRTKVFVSHFVRIFKEKLTFILHFDVNRSTLHCQLNMAMTTKNCFYHPP